MSLFGFLALVAGATILVGLLSMLLGPREPWDLAETPERFRSLQRAYDRTLRAMKDLEFDVQSGTLSAEEHAQLKWEYKERAIRIRKALERLRLAAVRRVAGGERGSPSRKEREEIEALVARAGASQQESMSQQ